MDGAIVPVMLRSDVTTVDVPLGSVIVADSRGHPDASVAGGGLALGLRHFLQLERRRIPGPEG